jgi:DNA-binding CsgD family transcriptional regulator
MLSQNNFSKREMQVINLLMEGKSNKQIATTLKISEGTVEFHLTKIYNKLGVGSRLEALIKLGQSGLTPDHPELTNIGEIPSERDVKLGETPVESDAENIYDVDASLPTKGDEMIGKKTLSPKKYMLLVITGLAVLVLAIVTLYMLMSRQKTWTGYERECEYPDQSTVGQAISRSNASGKLVYGQFGTIGTAPWSAEAGDAVYENINTPRVEALYLKLRYSKNSPPAVPILIYVDEEKEPRASIYPANQKDWNRFSWTDPVFLGGVESGIHTITVSTTGQEYGVVDLDKFILLADSP